MLILHFVKFAKDVFEGFRKLRFHLKIVEAVLLFSAFSKQVPSTFAWRSSRHDQNLEIMLCSV